MAGGFRGVAGVAVGGRLVGAVLACSLGFAACGVVGPIAEAVPVDGGTLAVGPAEPAHGMARTVLDGLPVKGRAPKTGYARGQFGPAWSDIDRDGCDQRNQVLARDMTDETFKPGTHSCVVLTGRLADPYTGTVIRFVRGEGTSDDVQIDHVVALSDAWQKGAQRLDAGTRKQLANDPMNLLAVDGPTNVRKSDADAATWLPPNKAYRCRYVARQVAVKSRYRLWVTSAERDAISKVLTQCPGEPVPEPDPAPPNRDRGPAR